MTKMDESCNSKNLYKLLKDEKKLIVRCNVSFHLCGI